MNMLSEEEYQRRRQFVIDALSKNPNLTRTHFETKCSFGRKFVQRLVDEGVVFGAGIKKNQLFRNFSIGKGAQPRLEKSAAA